MEKHRVRNTGFERLVEVYPDQWTKMDGVETHEGIHQELAKGGSFYITFPTWQIDQALNNLKKKGIIAGWTETTINEGEKTEERNTDTGFGVCPECGFHDGYLNVRKNIWFVCDQCKTKWSGGYGLFSSWEEETEADWERNLALLDTYRTVESAAGKNLTNL
jgi:ribosomal protein L37AE/L43A